MSKINMAVIGCGDYIQRWESAPINNSTQITVKSLFDLDQKKAEQLQSKIGGEIVSSADVIFSDPEVEIVCIFVPPWVRKNLMLQAAKSGKNIITTKPLAPGIEDAQEILDGINGRVKSAVFYRRAGDAVFVKLREIFESNQIGKLALYRQDWLHHYPQWNDWATDPDKNGGPFMDAMIHNMNIARFLMGRKTTHVTYFSDNHAHDDLKCNDTEFMKLDFEDRGSAHLFITWAADLEVFSLEGNDREHIDIFYMVTNQGWHVTVTEKDGNPLIRASRKGEIKTWVVEPLELTPYDAVARSVKEGIPMRSDITNLQEAFEDILILKKAEKNNGVQIAISV